MERLLGREYAAFLSSCDDPPAQGLRINTLKWGVEQAVAALPWALTPVPWCPSGFRIDPQLRVGKQPLHAAGLYYLQEPSAMAAAELLQVQRGHLVIDVSASPGGKATHLASLLAGTGLLVANDPVRGRIKALGENLERWGVRNAVIANVPVRDLVKSLAQRFDRVLVDAPCSGEGMFRKSPVAVREWSEEHVRGCALRQEPLLADAARLVNPGGLLLYSTCTFSAEENEAQISRFLEHHAGWELQTLAIPTGGAPGRPDWIQGPKADRVAGMLRLWPHLMDGEGHAFALLRAPDSIGETADLHARRLAMAEHPATETINFWERFRAEYLPGFAIEGQFVQRGEYLFLMPETDLPLSKLAIVRPSLPLGIVRSNRFEPSHALALALPQKAFAQSVEISEDESLRYLSGETIRSNGRAGWLAMTTLGFPLGWGKRSGDTIKNHYPKGLRW